MLIFCIAAFSAGTRKRGCFSLFSWFWFYPVFASHIILPIYLSTKLSSQSSKCQKRKQMWIISLLFAFTRFVRRIRKELTEPDPSQSKNKEKSIFRKNVCEESWKYESKMQWKSVAIDGGSGRRASQEIETVRRKSAQNPEIRVGVAKIFYFFRLSN